MRTRYIPAIITLLAGAVTGIICIVNSYRVLESLKLLLVVLIIFFIIGQIAKGIIIKAINENAGGKEDETREEVMQPVQEPEDRPEE